jgi:putative transposase
MLENKSHNNNPLPQTGLGKERRVLDNHQIQEQFNRFGLTEEAIALIEQVQTAGPSRSVRSGAGNVHGRYPSKKMGLTIQFESHQVELPAIYELEHDPQVLEFYDQPPPIKLDYLGLDGRRRSHLHTPDFFVIGRDVIGWEECKTEEALLELEKKNPNRYCRTEQGNWRAPAGEEFAAKFGLSYRVRSSRNINWIFQRNIHFLEDYYRAETPFVSEDSRAAVRAVVTNEPGLTLAELLHSIESITSRDDVFTLIADGGLYVDIYKAPLVEPEKVQVFSSKQASIAHGLVINYMPRFESAMPQVVEVAIGRALSWNGILWNVINVGDGQVSLVDADKNFVELPQTTVETLIQEGKITSSVESETSPTHPVVKQALVEASEEDFARANRRCEIVRLLNAGAPLPENHGLSQRTLRRWAKAYCHYEEAYGCGYAGLLPRTRQRGYRGSKLPAATQQEMERFIENDYEDLRQKRMFEVWGALLRSCNRKSLIAPSYKTFAKAVKSSDRYKQTLKRRGHRAAYQVQSFYWILDQRTPRHGDRPLEIVHIDHTQLDVECDDSETGESRGRPWLSSMVDAYSRKFLAVCLDFDPPSYRACMTLLRECVRQHHRLPQTIVVDGGAEFQSIYFETLLARYECTKKVRPAAKARFGSICERLFNTTNTQFIHNLRGNTQITKNVRQVTKSVNPKNHRIWSLPDLHARLCEYVYEVYDKLQHSSLGQSPREAFAAGLLRTGNRPHRFIPFDNDFRIATMPSTPKGTAKVTGRGIKVNKLFYWSSSFRSPLVEKCQVPVRYDPYDAGTVYAFISNRWVVAHSEYFSVFSGKSEKELMLATKELRARRSQTSEKVAITAKQLAEFLQSVEGDEALMTQRRRDRELRAIYQSMGDSSATAYIPESNHGNDGAALEEEILDCSVDEEFEPEMYEEYV